MTTPSTEVQELLWDARAGDRVAQFNLGLAYANGHGVAKDEKAAFDWYRRAAEQGYAGAQNNLGKMYQMGVGVAKDERTAFEWYHRAAEQGDAAAQNNLGTMYRMGVGVAKDEMTAFDWYRRAAEQGYAGAQNNLGTMYQMGVGVAKDERTAFEWYHRAAEQGYAAAQVNLGVMYEDVAKDEKTAFRWYRRAAEQGDVLAQKYVGEGYEKGQGVAKDEKTAFEWYRRAAEQGDAQAQHHLGWMYAKGRGIAKDKRTACKWYHRAAEQGHALAQFKIGWRHLIGQGCNQNDKDAFVWIQRSVEQKVPVAEYWLGWMYKNGRGVIKNEIKAMELYAKAANNISVIRDHAEKGRWIPAQEALKALTTKEVQGERKAIVEKAWHVGDSVNLDHNAFKQERKGEQEAKRLHEETKASAERFHSEMAERLRRQDSYIHEQLEKMAEFEANFKQAIRDSKKTSQEHRSELTRIRNALDSIQQFDPMFHTLKARENELISVLDREEEHQCALREKSKISKNDSLYSFYYMFRRLFNDIMNACKLIDSGMLEDIRIAPIGKTTKIIDRISKIVRKVAGNVPIINIFVEVFTTALDTASEIIKEKAVQSASTYLPDSVEVANIAELLARYLTLAEEHNILRKSNVPPTGRVKKIINAITVNDIDTEVKKYAEALFKIFLSKVFTNKIKKCPEASDIPELIFAITNRHFNLTINLLNNHVSQNSLLINSQGPVFDREAKLLQEIERLKTLVVQTEAKHRAEMESQRWEDIKRREEEEARRRQDAAHFEKRFATIERGIEEAFAKQGGKEQGSKEQGREPSKKLIFNRIPQYDQAVAEMETNNRFQGQDAKFQGW